jgi:hypothetical protein
MHHLRTAVAALIVVIAGSLAHAFEFPPDAEFIVTDAQGVIVAIGRTVGGTSASVEVLSGFEGPARLTLFTADGSTRAIDVAIENGVVAIEGIDLRVLLAETFADVTVRFVAEPGASADPPGGEPGGGDPPGQDRRPEEPPGQDRRPEEPPGQDRRPEEPPGQTRRP